MYKITLNDGTELTNLELNGNNYISNTVIENSVFENNLDTVTITDGEVTETYKDMQLMSNLEHNGKSWFVIAEKSQEQKEREALLKDLKVKDEAIANLEDALCEITMLMEG